MSLQSATAPIPVSGWTEREVIQANLVPTPRQVCCEQSVQLFLPQRAVYLYLEANLNAAGSFQLDTQVIFRNKGQVVSVLPCRLADFTGITPNQSLSRLFNSGGSPVGNSAVLTLANPFNPAITTVTVQPFNISVQADEALLLVTGVALGAAPMIGFRAWLGILSTAS